jgi:hypothetical protein
MEAESGAGAARAYDVTFALSDAEIELLIRLTRAKLLKVARLGRYITWIAIAAGVVLSFSAGTIVLRYYALPPGSNAGTLVMVLFSFFLAGSYLYGWLLKICYGKVYAHRILRRKETVRVRLSGDGIIYSAKDRETKTSWTFIEEVTFFAGTMVLWVDPDTVLMIPLRAVSPPEDRALFSEAVRSWMTAAAAAAVSPVAKERQARA